MSGCETPPSFLAGARSQQATPGCEASVLSPSEIGSQHDDDDDDDDFNYRHHAKEKKNARGKLPG